MDTGEKPVQQQQPDHLCLHLPVVQLSHTLVFNRCNAVTDDHEVVFHVIFWTTTFQMPVSNTWTLRYWCHTEMIELDHNNLTKRTNRSCGTTITIDRILRQKLIKIPKGTSRKWLGTISKLSRKVTRPRLAMRKPNLLVDFSFNNRQHSETLSINK